MPKLGVVPMSLKSVQMRHRIHLDANSSFNMLALCSRRLTIAHYRYALNMKAKRLFSESAVEETEQAEGKLDIVDHFMLTHSCQKLFNLRQGSLEQERIRYGSDWTTSGYLDLASWSW